MDSFIFILIMALPLLLLMTYMILIRVNSFYKIFAIHTIVFISYMIFTIYYSKLIFPSHDEYGLGPIVLGVIFITGHIITGFAHAIYVMFKMRK